MFKKQLSFLRKRRFAICILVGMGCCPGESFAPATLQRPKNARMSSGRQPGNILFGQNDQDVNPEVKPDLSLIELLLPSENCKVNQMSGTDLAYIGDVVFELFVRSRNVWPSRRTSDLQNIVVSTVRAEHQSKLLAKLKQDFPLSDKEQQVMMRGRNAVTRSKNRRNPAAYQDSTSFEALIGYLFISDRDRCTELLNWLAGIVDDV